MDLPVLPATDADLERAEAHMLPHVQPVTFLRHHFAPGIYVREIWMPRSAMILGHRHKTDHLNIITQGKVLVRMDGRLEMITAGPLPYTVRSGAGVRKALYIIEDTTWMTVHDNPTDERDIAKLEDMFTEKSETYQKHELETVRRELFEAMEKIT
jgi:hypothetical protein